MRNTVLLILISFVVVVAGFCTTYFTYPQKDSVETSLSLPEESVKKEITLRMVGDNLLHTPIIKDAQRENDTYSFDNLYTEMRPYFLESDLSVLVQETILGGDAFPYSGYPLFNSPFEVADAVKNAGFDIILHATNHTLDKGERGILNAIECWKKYPEITVLGISDNPEKKHNVTYRTVNGINLALLNYTDSTNGIPVPASKPYLVNTVKEDVIQKDLQIAEENADFTIVFMHWGTEYKTTPDNGQKKLAKMMAEFGADLIMGSHPHVLEPVEWIESDNGNKALVYYSLGNYVSRQREVINLLGGMGTVKICSDEENGTYIESAQITPTFTHYNRNAREFRVYPLKDYTDELANEHGVAQYDGKVTLQRIHKIFDSIFAECTAVAVKY